MESKAPAFNTYKTNLKTTLNTFHNYTQLTIMQKSLLLIIVGYFFAVPVFSQIKFSDETKKYIEYNDSITVFKNGLLIDGTLNGSIALGFDKTIGTIETGKNANLLIINGDPSKNISDIRKAQFVFENGVGYNSKKLFESVIKTY